MSRTRSIIRLVLLVAVFVAGCAYGMLAERTQRFPHTLARTVLSTLRGDARDGRDAAVPAAGRWNRWRPSLVEGELTDEQKEEMSRLESIGYLTGSVPAGERSGVTVYDKARAEAGLNMVVSGHRPWAALMDMDGNVVHEWRFDFEAAWPGREMLPEVTGDDYWRRVLLLDDGGIVAIHEGLGIIRLDRDSKLIWAEEGGFHHDLERTPDGGFVVLDREARLVPRIGKERPVLEDFVAYLDADGNVLRRFSLLEAVERSPYASMLTRMD